MWYTIDQWAITRDREHLHNAHAYKNHDQLESSVFTIAMLYQVFNGYCDPNAHHINKAFAVKYATKLVKFENESYIVDMDGNLRQFVGNKTCQSVLRTTGTTKLTRKQFLQFPIGPNIEDICIKGVLLKSGKSDAVFVYENQALHGFLSANALTNRGYKFEDVILIDDWQLSLIEVGNSYD
jgi:hypothetical protein